MITNIFLGGFGIIVGLLIGYCVGFKQAIPLPSYRNSAVCSALPKDQSVTSLIHALGAPIGAENDYLLFTGSPTGAPISAKVDKASGKIIELLCNNETK